METPNNAGLGSNAQEIRDALQAMVDETEENTFCFPSVATLRRARAALMEKPQQHYTVELDREGCSHCGAGNRWTVVSDGVAIGQSFNQVADAEELANYMNEAFERGKSNGNTK